MKKIKIISLLLAMLMVFTVLAGCGDDGNDQTAENQTADSQRTDSNTDGTEGSGAQMGSVPENEKVSYSAFPERLTATKINSIDKSNITTYGSGGIYYKENDKYGIMSYDGTKDTGAKYAYCSYEGNYFAVITAIPTNTNDIKSMNCMGLVNVNGDLIIPEKYCSFRILNDRFAQAYEVTGTTDSKDDALIYSSNSQIITISPDEDDDFFTGNWYIYDLTTGEKVPGATGTKSYANSATGGYVNYYTDDRERHEVNSKGEPLPDGISLFTDGSYRTVEGNKGAVCDMNGNKLFDYDLNGFEPYSLLGEYYVGSKYDNGTMKYVVFDRSGKIISSEFDESPYFEGKLLSFYNDENKHELYDFNGNKVIDGAYKYIYEDKLGIAYLLINDDEFTMIRSDGTVIYKGVETDDLYCSTSDFTIRNKIGDDVLFYCVKDKDFTIKGYTSNAPWLVEAMNEDYTYDVIDTISGETLISGYEDYYYISISGSVTYVYAEKDGGGYDIYTVK